MKKKKLPSKNYITHYSQDPIKNLLTRTLKLQIYYYKGY